MSRPGRAPQAVLAVGVQARPRQTVYPEPYASQMAGREKCALGDVFNLGSFGVNLTRLPPWSGSALQHAHSLQDEFVYVLEGTLTLRTEHGRQTMAPGMCAGFPARTRNAHHLRNVSDLDAVYLVIGDRTAGDSVFYPDDDLHAAATADGWAFTRKKNGEPYP